MPFEQPSNDPYNLNLMYIYLKRKENLLQHLLITFNDKKKMANLNTKVERRYDVFYLILLQDIFYLIFGTV